MALLVSKTLRASQERMHNWAGDLSATHPGFNRWVILQHCEGSQQLFNSAFTVDDPVDPEYFWVFTEHHGYHAFPKDEVDSIIELERVERSFAGPVVELKESDVLEPQNDFDDEEDTIPRMEHFA